MELKAKEVLVAVAAKNGGVWSKMYKSIIDRIKPTDKEIERFSPLAEQAVVILDEDYPNTWKNAYRPPMVATDGCDPDGFYGWGDYWRWKNG